MPILTKVKSIQTLLIFKEIEPVFNPVDLKKIIKSTKKNPRLIYGGYCKIREKNDYINSSIPKVVVSKNEDLMYMSRAGIPSNKKKIYSRL